MTNEMIQDFTRRLSQCNRGEMVVIIYDIYFAYDQDIRDAHAAGEHEDFKKAVQKAQDTLQELIGSLDFSYDLSNQLYQLYVFCKNELSKSLYENSLEHADEARKIMHQLYESFVVAAKEDASDPLMSNTQQVYAGMTYGRDDLKENCVNDENRGFLA